MRMESSASRSPRRMGKTLVVLDASLVKKGAKKMRRRFPRRHEWCAVLAIAGVALAQAQWTRALGSDAPLPSPSSSDNRAAPRPPFAATRNRDGLSKGAFPRAPIKVDWRVTRRRRANRAAARRQERSDHRRHDPRRRSSGSRTTSHEGRGELRAPVARHRRDIFFTAARSASDGTVVVVGGVERSDRRRRRQERACRFRTQLAGGFPVSDPIFEAVAPLALDDGWRSRRRSRPPRPTGTIAPCSTRPATCARAAPLTEAFIAGRLMAGGHKVFASLEDRRRLRMGAGQPRASCASAAFQGSVQGKAPVMTSDDTLPRRRLGSAPHDARRAASVSPFRSPTFTGGAYLGPVAVPSRDRVRDGGSVPGRTFAIAVDFPRGRKCCASPSRLSSRRDDGRRRAGLLPFPSTSRVAVDDTGTVGIREPRTAPIGNRPTRPASSRRSTAPARGRYEMAAPSRSLVSDGPCAYSSVTCALSGHVVKIIHGSGSVDSP